MKIYTHDIAAIIVEKFEDVLDEQGVTLTSPEDDEKEPGNEARLYGSTYDELLDTTENIIIETLDKAGVSKDGYIPYEFSGTM